jgi:hypothetical protein
MAVPVEPTDDELLSELKRIRSDLGFRKWISLRVRIVAALILFDLLVSLLSIGAVAVALNAQHSACVRDDDLRAAYTAQWQPLLDEANKANDPSQAEVRQRFQIGLDGFKQHGCTQPNYPVIVGVIVGVVVLITGAGLFVRWLVVTRRRATRGGTDGD